MNCNFLKFFSQNIRKNKLIVNTILETQFSYDIIFIQESPWFIICSIPSSNNCKGEPLVGVSHHLNWITFTRPPSNQLDYPRVMTFINICISYLRFSLWNNILNHRDISCISFLNQSSIFFIINVYSNSSQSALKYLKDTEVNISNVIIMIGDFNIRDSIWDPNFLFHLCYNDSLFDIVDFFSLNISKPIKNVPTRFSDNDNNANSVVDLVFLCLSFPEFNCYIIHPDWRLSSDYTLITVNILIYKERISYTRQSLVKGSDEGKKFIKSIIQVIKNLNISYIHNTDTLEEVVQLLLSKIEKLWQKYLKPIKITRHSKAWWTDNCRLSLDRYQYSQNIKNWYNFKSTVKRTKHSFFDNKIQEIANKKYSPWKLMSWVKKHKLPAIKVSRLQKVDLVSFYFIFQFLETLGLGLEGLVTLSHQSHLMVWSQHWSWDLREGSRRFWNKMTSYNIDIIYWPHAWHIVI